MVSQTELAVTAMYYRLAAGILKAIVGSHIELRSIAFSVPPTLTGSSATTTFFEEFAFL